MANYYVWNGATGGGTGADWANAYVNLTLAIASKVGGDVFYVAHDHVQTQASALTLLMPGSNDMTACRIYCVNRTGSVPPVAADLRTTATVATTGAFAITLSGPMSECYGLTFSAGDAANSASLNIGMTSNRSWRLVNCALRLGNTNAASRINFGGGVGNVSFIYLENCTMQFGNVSQQAVNTARIVWRGGAIIGATIPTISLGWTGGTWFLEGVDLSALITGKTVFQLSVTNPNCFGVMKDCKLGVGGAVGATPTSSYGQAEVSLIRCDSIDTNYRAEKYNYSGTQSVETAIVLAGGASDGTTPISWKILTSFNVKWEYPFESLPITIWNDSVGSPKTVTIQGVWGTGTLPKNDDIFIVVEYLGTSGVPLGSTVTSGKTNLLEPNADVLAGSGTWGGGTTKFAMSATFTPQEKGPITIYVKVGKANATYYIDPKPVITP